MAITIDPHHTPSLRLPDGSPSSPDRGRRAFRAARRHSILVRTLRYLLPALAVLLVASLAWTTASMIALRKAGITVSDVRITSESLLMATPRYDGYAKDGSRYEVRARSAEAPLDRDAPVRLNEIEGDLTQTTGVVTRLKAARGTYDQKSGVLELMDAIDVRASDGLSARLTTATVHTKESRIVSRQPIEASTSAGRLKARSMELHTKSKRATFQGDVHVIMTPSPQPSPASSDAPRRPASRAPTMPGIGADSAEPIEIRSELLLVNDADRSAGFRRRVVAQQGAARLSAPELDVHYEGRATTAGAPATTAGTPATPARSLNPSASPDAPQGDGEPQQRLKELIARGGVVVSRHDDHIKATSMRYDAVSGHTLFDGPVHLASAGDRTATAARLAIDHKADRIELEGGVVVTQARNVLRGERLIVDRARGRSQLDTPATATRGAGRIHALLHRPETSPRKAPDAKAAAKEIDGPLGAFRADPSQPITIDAAQLDVDENRRTALFSGSVVARQGTFVMRTPSMTAYYVGDTGLTTGRAPTTGQSSLKRIEARNGVVFDGADGQRVSGDWADIDPVANFATVGGRVVAAQGRNIVEGSRMIIDMTSGRTRFETATDAATAPPQPSAVPCPSGQPCASKGRVRAVFYPKDVKKQQQDGARALPSARAKRQQQPGAPAATQGPASSSWQSTTHPAPGDGAR